MKRRLFLLSVHFFSMVIISRLLSIPAAELIRNIADSKSLRLVVKIIPDDASNYFYLGLLKHYDILNPDLNQAVDYYKAALKKNPLYSRAWFNLAAAYQSAHNEEESFSAMDNFYRLNPVNPDRIWDTGVFYLVYGVRMEKSMEYFRKYIIVKPESQSKVYDICRLMNIPNNYIINNLLSDKPILHSEYLKYLIEHKRLDDAIDFWNTTNHQFIEAKISLKFCNFLIKNQRYDDASSLWEEMDKEDIPDVERAVLSNGSFENDIKNSCFDWIIGKADGANTYIDGSIYSKGYRSLRVSFDGEHNIDMRVIRQIVLLEAGSAYVLSADIKTDNLTTTNGLFFEVRGHDCKGLYEKSEVVTGAKPWKTIHIRFSVPPECRAVDISLRRQISRKFNNKIKGNAWIDGIELINAKTGS